MNQLSKNHAAVKLHAEVGRLLHGLPSWQVEYLIPTELQQKLEELDRVAAEKRSKPR